MIAQGAAGAGDAAQNHDTTTVTDPNPDPNPQPAANDKELFGTPLGAILGEMDDLPAEVRDSELKDAAAKGEPAAAKKPGTDNQPQPNDDIAPTKVGDPKPKPGAPGADEDHPVQDDWPESAKRRVAEEAQKRRDRTKELETAQKERDDARREADELKKRPPVQVQPNARDPLADVTDLPTLQKAERHWEGLNAWATRNPDGLRDVKIGKDKEGNPITRDYSAEEMAEIRLQSDFMLRKGIPAKAALLNVQAQVESEAREVYPDLFKPETEVGQEYNLILQQLPELRLFPDFVMWIGDAIYRRNERIAAAAAEAEKQNGKAKPSQTVAALTNKPQRAPTPAVVRTAAPEKTGRDAIRTDEAVDELERRAIASGGDDADIEALVGASLGRGQTRNAALV